MVASKNSLALSARCYVAVAVAVAVTVAVAFIWRLVLSSFRWGLALGCV